MQPKWAQETFFHNSKIVCVCVCVCVYKYLHTIMELWELCGKMYFVHIKSTLIYCIYSFIYL